MRKYLIIIFINLLLVFVQESFFLEFFGTVFNPHLVTSLGFSFILLEDDHNGLASMFIGGLLLDLLGTGVIGLSSLVLIVMLLISMLVRKTFFRGLITQIFFIILTTVVFKILMNYPHIIFDKNLILSGLITSFIALLFSFVIRRLKQRYLSLEFRIRA